MWRKIFLLTVALLCYGAVSITWHRLMGAQQRDILIGILLPIVFSLFLAALHFPNQILAAWKFLFLWIPRIGVLIMGTTTIVTVVMAAFGHPTAQQMVSKIWQDSVVKSPSTPPFIAIMLVFVPLMVLSMIYIYLRGKGQVFKRG